MSGEFLELNQEEVKGGRHRRKQFLKGNNDIDYKTIALLSRNQQAYVWLNSFQMVQNF